MLVQIISQNLNFFLPTFSCTKCSFNFSGPFETATSFVKTLINLFKLLIKSMRRCMAEGERVREGGRESAREKCRESECEREWREREFPGRAREFIRNGIP